MSITKTRRTRPPGAYVGSEDAFQRTAITLVRTIASTQGVPMEAVMHIPNGGQRNAIVGAKLKGMGTIPGYPDVMVFHPRRVFLEVNSENYAQLYAGLAIELKIYPRNPSDAQLGIHEILRDAGWKVEVCYGLDEVCDAVNEYFGIK